jgi:hypothetical protein
MKPKPGKIQVGSLLTETIYRRAKAQAILENRNVGVLIDEAIEMYLEKIKQQEAKNEEL